MCAIRSVALLDRFIDSMREQIERFVQRDPAARRIWELIDLLAANIRGLVAAGLEGTDDFSSLDEWNYDDWLRMNRIAERTLRNPMIRGATTWASRTADGDPRNPQIAAGQAINAGCRFFFMYKGALFWRMKAGMGDVVFAPMYLALRNRGVKFRFFHRLDEIELERRRHGRDTAEVLAPGESSRSRTIRLPTNYEPLIVIKGQQMSGWPEKPDHEQFDYDDETREEYERAVKGEDEETYVNFESIWCNWEHGDDVFATVGDGPARSGRYHLGRSLRRCDRHRADRRTGAGVETACRSQQRRGARWRRHARTLGTVATQSVQLWVNRTTRELGWTHGQVSFSAFVHPFDTWADLSQLVEVENQPERAWRALFLQRAARTGRAGDRRGSGDTWSTQLEAVKELVKQNAKRFLNEWIFHLWPNAVDRYPNVFKWELLVDKLDRAWGQRLDAQHFVANVDPSERYTQSLPGTTKYRIRPDETGFTHLFIAGDWTDCGFNFGCVEAAVISGRLASSAITRISRHETHSRVHQTSRPWQAAKGGN